MNIILTNRQREIKKITRNFICVLYKEQKYRLDITME